MRRLAIGLLLVTLVLVGGSAGPVGATDASDLELTLSSVTPSGPVTAPTASELAGKTIEYSVTVTNAGGATSAPTGVGARVYGPAHFGSGVQQVTGAAVPALDPGASTTLSFTATLAASGNATVVLVASVAGAGLDHALVVTKAVGVDPPEPLKKGDVVVGDYDGIAGGIERIRDGSVTRFCSGVSSSIDNSKFFLAPTDVMVDAEGRVVFFAGNSGGLGVYRCDYMGAEPTKLVFYGDPAREPGGFPISMSRPATVGSLHLRYTETLDIVESVSGRKVEMVPSEKYVWLTQSAGSPEVEVSYDPTTDELSNGSFSPIAGQIGYASELEAGDLVFSSDGANLRQVKVPLEVHASGQIDGLAWSLDFGLGGDEQDWYVNDTNGISRTFVVGDTVPWVDDPPCGNAPPLTPISFNRMAWDPWRQALLMSTNYAPWPGNVVRLSSATTFRHPGGGGCVKLPLLLLHTLVPHWNQAGYAQDINGPMTATEQGVFVTDEGGGVFSTGPGGSLEWARVASLPQAWGIDSFPSAAVKAGGRKVLAITIHSPVNVMLADPSGRRIGVDEAGNVVDDFGADGAVSTSTEPRVILVEDPSPGTWSMTKVATGDGPYSIDVAGVDTDAPDGEMQSETGTVHTGDTSSTPVVVTDAGSALLPATDSTAPEITPHVDGTLGDGGFYTSDVKVSWTVADPDSAVTEQQGCDDVTVTADTAGTELTCVATSAGGTNKASVTIARDATAPTITASRSPGANAAGWNDGDVTVSFTCDDSLSGVATCPDATAVTTEGAGQTVSATAVDRAGNRATATVKDISIDKTPPALACSTKPEALWPPDHKLVDVYASVSVTDPLSGAGGFTLLSVTSSEPGAAGDIRGFTIGTPDRTGKLRAERLGTGTGRVYTLTYEAVDAAGNTARCAPTVAVRHGR